jgi:hypothetical protein
VHHVGAENVLPHIQAALARATDIQEDFGAMGREFARQMELGPLSRRRAFQSPRLYGEFVSGQTLQPRRMPQR